MRDDGGHQAADSWGFVLDLSLNLRSSDGTADTGWIDRAQEVAWSAAGSGIAPAVAAGIEAYEDAEAIERTRLRGPPAAAAPGAAPRRATGRTQLSGAAYRSRSCASADRSA